MHACRYIYIYIYTALKGSKAKSNCHKGLCSGLRARDLATSAPSSGLIEYILLMSARVRTLLLGRPTVYPGKLSDLPIGTHARLIYDDQWAQHIQQRQWVAAIPIYILYIMITEHNIYSVDSVCTWSLIVVKQFRSPAWRCRTSFTNSTGATTSTSVAIWYLTLAI